MCGCWRCGSVTPIADSCAAPSPGVQTWAGSAVGALVLLAPSPERRVGTPMVLAVFPPAWWLREGPYGFDPARWGCRAVVGGFWWRRQVKKGFCFTLVQKWIVLNNSGWVRWCSSRFGPADGWCGAAWTAVCCRAEARVRAGRTRVPRAGTAAGVPQQHSWGRIVSVALLVRQCAV